MYYSKWIKWAINKSWMSMSIKGLTKDLINECKTFNRKGYFSSGTLQNHLTYFFVKKYFWFFSNTFQVLSWKSIALSEESIENITISCSNFAPTYILLSITRYKI